LVAQSTFNPGSEHPLMAPLQLAIEEHWVPADQQAPISVPGDGQNLGEEPEQVPQAPLMQLSPSQHSPELEQAAPCSPQAGAQSLLHFWSMHENTVLAVGPPHWVLSPPRQAEHEGSSRHVDSSLQQDFSAHSVQVEVV
jgi:hypothetical protein